MEIHERVKMSALESMVVSLTRELKFYRDRDYRLSFDSIERLQCLVESEREANELLTNEIEELKRNNNEQRIGEERSETALGLHGESDSTDSEEPHTDG